MNSLSIIWAASALKVYSGLTVTTELNYSHADALIPVNTVIR
jgi:hypothetical protein